MRLHISAELIACSIVVGFVYTVIRMLDSMLVQFVPFW